MKKKTYYSTNLVCNLQQDGEILPSHCHCGVISKTDDGFLFEEAIRKVRAKRNAKLFEGDFCSLVHMQNGKYQIHMKTIDASSITDRNDFAFKVYSELISAFHIID